MSASTVNTTKAAQEIVIRFFSRDGLDEVASILLGTTAEFGDVERLVLAEALRLALTALVEEALPQGEFARRHSSHSRFRARQP